MSFFGSRRQADAETPPTPKQPELPAPSIAPPQVGFETVLGANSSLEGTLRSSANIRLDGTFTGTLEITGNVLVGETAKINADVNAKNISIAGAVRGNISGKKVQLLRTGRVWGDIRAAALTTEEGAFIDGKITMMPHEKDTPQPVFGELQAVEPEALPEPAAAAEPTPSPTTATPYDRNVGGAAQLGLGATEEDADDMIHEPHEPPSGYADNPLIENISQGEAAELGAQTDSTEGQAEIDPTGEESQPVDDETKQST